MGHSSGVAIGLMSPGTVTLGVTPWDSSLTSPCKTVVSKAYFTNVTSISFLYVIKLLGIELI